MIRRPRLAKGEIVDLGEQQADSPLLRAQGTEVVTLETPDVAGALSRGTKLVIGFVVLLVTLIAAIYVGLSATLMTSVPSESGRLWVTRGTFVGGVVPLNSTVYASPTHEKPVSYLDKIEEGFVGAPGAIPVKVVSTQFSQVGVIDGKLSIDGNVTQFPASADKVKSRVLDNEYVVVDSKNNVYIIPAKNISGEVQGVITLSGIKKL